MKVANPKSGLAVLAVLAVVLIGIIHVFGAQLGVIGFASEHFVPGIVSSASFKRAVMHPERDDAYSAYDVLGERGSKIAQDIARQQIHSEDDYLWLNAAEYLGHLQDSTATPYLIKALRHTAWRTDKDTRDLLVKLTGQDFGTDFTKWQQWWIAMNPNSQMDWDSHLGFQPRIAKQAKAETNSASPR